MTEIATAALRWRDGCCELRKLTPQVAGTKAFNTNEGNAAVNCEVDEIDLNVDPKGLALTRTAGESGSTATSELENQQPVRDTFEK